MKLYRCQRCGHWWSTNGRGIHITRFCPTCIPHPSITHLLREDEAMEPLKLADIPSTEIDTYAVDLVIGGDRRMGHQLNPLERRLVIFGLAGKLNDSEIGELLGMDGKTVCQIRKRARETK